MESLVSNQIWILANPVIKKLSSKLEICKKGKSYNHMIA